MMLFALVLSVLGATTAVGQKIYMSEVDASMFKAWDGCGADAKEVANPEAIDFTDDNPEGTPFSCVNNLYKEVGDWTCIFGHPAAYYLWYADLAGSQKIYFKGTPGFKFWVQFNRQAPVEGGDAHGGDMTQTELTIGEDGTASYDCSGLPYLHLNCIKTKGSGIKGRLTSILIEGTMKPVTGFLPLVWNGDAEGDDLTNFPVSYDGPNNGGTANDKPEIVAGQGVNGSRCFKVVSFPDPTETWHTQFYVYADEVMPKGSKWILKMSIKADHDTKITTSAQAAPRTWKGGFINEFTVGNEWKDYTWSGEIGVDDFQSIAFDLNNSDERNADDNGWTPGNGNCGFYFDNIEFGYDLGSANPASEISAAYGADVIEINLNDKTNMKDLVKAADGKKVIFPNDCVNITWNGKPANPISVEGRDNGNLYVFLLDVDGNEDYDFSNDETAEVKVAFTNPAGDLRLLFNTGKWEGEPVPDFSGMVCKYNAELGDGDYVSYIWGAAELVSADPEDGSFNLPANLSEFTVTFNQKINVSTVKATLDKEKLTASAAEDFSKTITLKRTATGDLSGVKKLYIDHAVTDRDYDLDGTIVYTYSFGPVETGGDDQPEVFYTSNFTNDGDNAGGAGWIVTADINDTNPDPSMQPANSGAGNRLQHGQTGYAADVLYLAQRSAQAGIALYGTEEDYKLTLAGGKTYHLTLKSAQWDAYPSEGSNRTLRVQVLNEDAVSTEDGTIIDESGIIAEDFKVVNGRVKEDKEYTAFDVAFTPAAEGNFVIRLVAGDLNGNPAGFGDGNAIADVKVEYLPNVMGLLEMKALQTALDAAKATLEDNADERYAGTAHTALANLVNKYDSEIATMYAPSAFAKAVEDLNAAVKAMNDHHTLCDDYDKLPEQAFALYAEKKNTKFNATEEFANLKTVVFKYCTLGTEEVVNEETGEVTTSEVMESFKLFYDDAELTAAKDELTEVYTKASKMLTDGKSNNNSTTGYAALHERLRRGVELLQSLGVEEDAPEIVAANAELGDNDEIAAAIMKRASLEIYKDLSSGNSQLFAAAGEEESAPSYDLSVFVKNPNTYGPAESAEVPGWTATLGSVVAWNSWDGAKTHNNVLPPYAEDCSIHAGWHPNGEKGAIVQQTIENLPAGVYSVTLQFWENGEKPEDTSYAQIGYTYGFVQTSQTNVPEEGEEFDPDLHTAGTTTSTSTPMEGIEVVDGKLTIGLYYGYKSQAFLEDSWIYLTAPADGFNYADAYATSIDAAAAPKVRAIELYDLNGRRLSVARKGLVIVKKVMSDGSVKTEKVVK